MPIDPSIISGFAARFQPIQAPDPMDNYKKLLTIQAMRDQAEMGQMEMQQRRQAMADEEAYRNESIRSGGQITPERLYQIGLPKQAQAQRKLDIEFREKQLAIQDKLAGLDEKSRKAITENTKLLAEVGTSLNAIQDPVAKQKYWSEIGAPKLVSAKVQGVDPNVMPSQDVVNAAMAEVTATQAALDEMQSRLKPQIQVAEEGFVRYNPASKRLERVEGATPRKQQALVSIGNLGEPKTLVSKDTGEPVLVQFGKRGETREVPGYLPPERVKEVPQAVVKDLIENEGVIGQINKALSAVTKYPGAIGLSNKFIPDSILQRTDPKGVEARALLAQIKSLRYKDMSGAAVSVQEDARLAKYIPNDSDDLKTVQTKLKGLDAELKNIQSGYAESYSDGYRQIPLIQKYGPKRSSKSSESQPSHGAGAKKAYSTDDLLKLFGK